jgi:hypothetical protein
MIGKSGRREISTSVFDRVLAALAGQEPKPERIMIDSMHLKAHRIARRPAF